MPRRWTSILISCHPKVLQPSIPRWASFIFLWKEPLTPRLKKRDSRKNLRKPSSKSPRSRSASQTRPLPRRLLQTFLPSIKSACSSGRQKENIYSQRFPPSMVNPLRLTHRYETYLVPVFLFFHTHRCPRKRDRQLLCRH